MLGFDQAYECLREAVCCMDKAMEFDSVEQGDAYVRNAYENLYLAVNQASLGYEASLPYRGQIAGGFLDRCRFEEGEFCTVVHKRYYLDGDYPLCRIDDGLSCEIGNEFSEIREVFNSWFARARLFVTDSQANAQMVIHSDYARVDRSPSYCSSEVDYGW